MLEKKYGIFDTGPFDIRVENGTSSVDDILAAIWRKQAGFRFSLSRKFGNYLMGDLPCMGSSSLGFIRCPFFKSWHRCLDAVLFLGKNTRSMCCLQVSHLCVTIPEERLIF